MSENGKQHMYCRNESKIAKMETKIDRIEKVVMDGNGEEALATSVPKLSNTLETLTEDTIPDLQKEIRSFLQFQSLEIGRHEGKEGLRKRNRFIVGSLISVCSLLLVVVGILVGKLMV